MPRIGEAFHQQPEGRTSGSSRPHELLTKEVEARANFVKDLYGSENLFGHWGSVRVHHRFIEDHRHTPDGRKAVIDTITETYPSQKSLHDGFVEASNKGTIANYRRHEADHQEEEILHTIQEQLGQSFLALSVDMMREIDTDANTLADVRREDLGEEASHLKRITEFSAELLWKHRFSRLHARHSEHHLCQDLQLIKEMILGLRKTDGDFNLATRCYQKAKQLYGTWVTSHNSLDRLRQSEAYRSMETLDKLMTS